MRYILAQIIIWLVLNFYFSARARRKTRRQIKRGSEIPVKGPAGFDHRELGYPKSHPGYSIFLHGMLPPPLVSIEKREVKSSWRLKTDVPFLEDLPRFALTPYFHEAQGRGGPIAIQNIHHQLIFERETKAYYRVTLVEMRQRID